MHVRSARRALGAAVALIAIVGLVPGPAIAAPDDVVEASHRGWWQSNGVSGANDNYCVGRGCGDGTVRENNFFTFDLPNTSEAVTDASVMITNPYGDGAARRYSLHPVTTSLGDLRLAKDNPNPKGRAIFRDLQDGPTLGAATPVTSSEDPFYVSFNPQGRIALTKKLGSLFKVGGTLENDGAADLMFGSSSVDSVSLTLYLGPKVTAVLTVPKTVDRGSRVRIEGHLNSPYGPCEQAQEVSIRIGSKTKTDTTNNAGEFSVTQRIDSKTKVSVLSAGGLGASDQGCGAAADKATIKVS